MRESIKIFIIFTLVFFITSNVFAGEVDIAADSLEYAENCGRINAEGNVALNWEDKKIYADYVEFVIDKKIMNARGNVKVEENGSITRADSVSYNYNDETGDIKETFAYSSTVFMRAKSMKRQGNGTFVMENVKLSTCDQDDPHTYFRSKRGKLVLNKRVTIYNAVLYVGKIPIFYLPIFTKSLENDGFGVNLKFKVEPGYSGSGGPFLKTVVSCSLSETITGKFMFDYLHRRGNGYGGEINFLTNEVKAGVHVYWLDDLIDKKNKWQLSSYYFHRLNDLWTIRSEGGFSNTQGFNDYSFISSRKNKFSQDQVSTRDELSGNFSVTRSGSRTNLMMLLDHKGRYDSKDDGSKVLSQTFPKIEWHLLQRKTFMGTYHSLRFEYNRHYKEHIPKSKHYFYRRTSALRYPLTTKGYKLCERLVLKPTLAVSENWYDRDKVDDYKNDFFTQYFAELNLRFRATSWMYWNVKYKYRIRTAPNYLFYIDDDADDHGIEINDVPLKNTMYLGEKITVENKIKYSMLRNKKPSEQEPQWSPLITELTWTPKHFITVIAKELQFIKPCEFGSFHLDLRVGELEKAYVNFTSIYQNYDDTDEVQKSNEIKNVFGFGVWPTPKWRLDYNIRTTFQLNPSHMRMDNHELRLYRDGHCYNLGIGWKIVNSPKPGKSDFDVFFLFDLKTNMPFSGKAQDDFGYDAPNAIFYPWEDKNPTGTL